MPTKINISMIARMQSRNVTYSTKEMMRIFERLRWDAQKHIAARMILQASKTFADDQSAIKGRRELQQSLAAVSRYIMFKIDSIEHVN